MSSRNWSEYKWKLTASSSFEMEMCTLYSDCSCWMVAPRGPISLPTKRDSIKTEPILRDFLLVTSEKNVVFRVKISDLDFSLKFWLLTPNFIVTMCRRTLAISWRYFFDGEMRISNYFRFFQQGSVWSVSTSVTVLVRKGRQHEYVQKNLRAPFWIYFKNCYWVELRARFRAFRKIHFSWFFNSKYF